MDVRSQSASSLLQHQQQQQQQQQLQRSRNESFSSLASSSVTATHRPSISSINGTVGPTGRPTAFRSPMSAGLPQYGSNGSVGPTQLNLSIPLPSMWEPIVARSIKNFAVYTGDLSALIRRITSFHRVDLLVVAAEEVGSIGGTQKVEDDTDLKSGRPMSRISSSSSLSSIMHRTPPKPWTSRTSTSRASFSSILSSNSDLSSSVDDGDDHLSPQIQQYHLQFLHKLSTHYKRIAVAINVAKLYRAYDAKDKKIGSSFSKHFVKYVKHVLDSARFPISGFVLVGLEEAASLHPESGSLVIKLMSALRADRDVSGPGGKRGMRSIFVDEMGVRVTERIEFDEIVNRLKIEITLRDDFMVFGIEPIRGGPDRLDAALTRHVVSWYRGLGFHFWLCNYSDLVTTEPTAEGWDSFGQHVDDVKPPKLTALGDDSIFELAVHPAVKHLKATVETSYAQMNHDRSMVITPAVWSNLLDRTPMPDQAARFFAPFRRLLDGVTIKHFASAVYNRVETLTPGSFSKVIWVDRGMVDTIPSSAYVKRVIQALRDLPLHMVPHMRRLFGVVNNDDDDNGNEQRHVRKRTSFASGTWSRKDNDDDDMASTNLGGVNSTASEYSSALVLGIGSQSTEARRERMALSLRKNLTDLMSKKLLASLKRNVDVDSGKLNAKYQQCVETLKGILTRPTAATRWVLDVYSFEMEVPRGEEEVKALVKDLLQGLEDGTVNVWMASKAAFLTGETGGEASSNAEIGAGHAGDCVLGFAEMKHGGVHIYVSDDLKDVLEVTIHAFAKLVLGWTTGRCLLFEALMAAQSQAASDDTFPIPSRLPQEIEGHSHMGRLRLIRNTPTVLSSVLYSKDLTQGEATYLTHLTHHISNLSEQHLIAKQSYLDLKFGWAKHGYAPANELEVALCDVVGKCTFDITGTKRFLAVVETMTTWMTTFPSSSERLAACLLYMAIQKAVRRCAYMECS
ncbi:hypothetical protein BC829DRAFT_391687 [Chytridium lagenaria]|nr:hypothetical protein BC829DRAFT_391687 [Chytridium lagenaria]